MADIKIASDSGKLYAGVDADLEIYSNGSHSYISNATAAHSIVLRTRASGGATADAVTIDSDKNVTIEGNLTVNKAITFNESSAVADFRVESDDNQYMLFVDADVDRVGIGTSTPISALEIEDGLTTGGAILTLGTKEPTVVANDVLGRINFYAPLDTGTDSDEIGASIVAIAQDTFSDSVNSTALQFQTGKSEVATTKMTIDEDGYVGIGEAGPNFPLHISAADQDHGTQLLLDTGNNDMGCIVAGSGKGHTHAFIGNFKFNFTDPSASVNLYTNAGEGIQMDGATGIRFYATPNATVDSSFQPAERMTILAESGNVGIGTASPGATVFSSPASATTPTILEIQSVDTSTDVGIMLSRGTDYVVGMDMWCDISTGINYIDQRYNADGGDLIFRTKTNGTAINAMTIDGLGKIGIGTTSPSQMLHINGAVPTILFTDGTNGDLGFIGDAQDFLTTNSPGADSFGVRSEGDLRFGTGGNNLRMLIGPTGKVKIGSGSGTLNFSSDANGYADDLVIYSDNGGDGTGITIFSETDEYGTLYFADGTTGNEHYRGYIQYSHAADRLELWTAGTMKLSGGPASEVEIGDVDTYPGGCFFKFFAVANNTDTTFFTTPGDGEWCGVVEVHALAQNDVNRCGYLLARFGYDETFTSMVDSSQNLTITLKMSGTAMQVNCNGGSSVCNVQIRVMGAQENA